MMVSAVVELGFVPGVAMVEALVEASVYLLDGS
jgi:hypothetical protein